MVEMPAPICAAGTERTEIAWQAGLRVPKPRPVQAPATTSMTSLVGKPMRSRAITKAARPRYITALSPLWSWMRPKTKRMISMVTA